MSTQRPAARTQGRTFDRALIGLEALAGLSVIAAIVGKTYGAASTLFFIIAGLAVAFTLFALIRVGTSWRDDTLDVVGRVRDVERETLEHEKMLLLHGIKELESDTAVGKVDARDYQYLRSTAEARAIEIIDKLRSDDARWLLEAERLVEKRLGKAGVRTNGSHGPALPSEPPQQIAPGVRLFFVRADGIEPADPACFDDREVEVRETDGRLSCIGCGAENDPSGRYCIQCGRPRRTQEREGQTA
jgi:hypothetical protein